MVYLVIAVIFLHIISLPITIGVTVYINSDEKIGRVSVRLFFIPVFKKKLDIERIKSKLKSYELGEDKVSENGDKDKKSGGAIKKFLLELAKNIAMRVRVRALDVDCKIGTGDAALDAMAVGAFRIVYDQACAFFRYDGGNSRIYPHYDGELLYSDFDGIISLCIADIIYALICTCATAVGSGANKRRKKYADTVAE